MARKKITLSRAASNYKKKLIKQYKDASALELDLIDKLVEQWDTYNLTGELLQEYVQQTGSMTISTTTTTKAHPLFQMQQQALAAYLSVKRELQKNTIDQLPEIDAVDDYLED